MNFIQAYNSYDLVDTDSVTNSFNNNVNSIKEEPKKIAVHERTKQWITAFTQEALDLGVKQRAIELKKLPSHVVDVKEIVIPNKTTHSYVGWDQGIVIEVGKESLPFSTEFANCIAVLVRAYKAKSREPSFLALHHVWMKPKNLTNTLKTTIAKIQKGTLEIFMSGGIHKHSAEAINNIYDIINEFQFAPDYKEIKFRIVDTTLNICDLGIPNKMINGMCYPERCGLSHVGFDQQQRPFQVVCVSCNFEYDKSKLEEVMWDEISM